MSATNMGETTTVGFRCTEEAKDDLQRKLVELQHEGKIPLDAKKSDVLRALAEMWVEDEIEVDVDRIDT